MEFPFQQVLKMGSILRSGLFIIKEHQDFCTLFTVHCFLNWIHAWNLYSLPCPLHAMRCLRMCGSPLNLMSQLKLPPTGPLQKIKHWALLILKILLHHPLFFGFWGTFPTFSFHLKYFCLLLKLEDLHWNPRQSWKAHQQVPEVRNPLKLYTYKFGCIYEEAIPPPIFSMGLRSLKVINHSHKSFFSLSFPGFNCYLWAYCSYINPNLSEIWIHISNWLFSIFIKLNQHMRN